MNQTILERISDCQASLIDALDTRDVDAIEEITATLSKLLSEAGSTSPAPGQRMERETLDFAIRQSDAARIRVNYLSSWTRQRIDRLAELRGQPAHQNYTTS